VKSKSRFKRSNMYFRVVAIWIEEIRRGSLALILLPMRHSAIRRATRLVESASSTKKGDMAVIAVGIGGGTHYRQWRDESSTERAKGAGAGCAEGQGPSPRTIRLPLTPLTSPCGCACGRPDAASSAALCRNWSPVWSLGTIKVGD
jgi:hypothetical protein